MHLSTTLIIVSFISLVRSSSCNKYLAREVVRFEAFISVPLLLTKDLLNSATCAQLEQIRFSPLNWLRKNARVLLFFTRTGFTKEQSKSLCTSPLLKASANKNSFIYLEKLDPTSDPTKDPYEVENFFGAAYSNQREASKIIITGDYSYYSWWTLHTWWKIADLLKVNWQDFYRVVRVYWVYNKRSGCPNNKPEECPKEMRFCVKVFYTASLWWQHAKELCSIMTNFQE